MAVFRVLIYEAWWKGGPLTLRVDSRETAGEGKSKRKAGAKRSISQPEGGPLEETEPGDGDGQGRTKDGMGRLKIQEERALTVRQTLRVNSRETADEQRSKRKAEAERSNPQPESKPLGENKSGDGGGRRWTEDATGSQTHNGVEPFPRRSAFHMGNGS